MTEEDDIDMDPDGKISVSYENLLTPPRQNNTQNLETPNVKVTDSNSNTVHQYILRRLQIFDLKSDNNPLPISNLDKDDQHKILELFNSLIKLRESDIDHNNDQSDEISRIRQDAIHHQTKYANQKKVEQSLKKKLGKKENEYERMEKRARIAEDNLKKEKSQRILFEKKFKQKLKAVENKNTKLEQENVKLKDRVSGLQRGKIAKGSPPEMVINRMNEMIKGRKSTIPLQDRRGKKRNKDILRDSIRKTFEKENHELKEEMNVFRESVRRLVQQVFLLRNVVYRRKGKEFNPVVKEDEATLSKSIDLPFKEYSQNFVKDTAKKLVEEIEEVTKQFVDHGEQDFVDKYHSINRILIDSLTNDEDSYQQATEILSSFNERIYYLQDLLIQQNNLLKVEIIESEKRGLFDM